MDNVIVLIVMAVVAFVMFRISSARETRRMLDLAEVEILTGTMGPNNQFQITIESVLALIAGAACMIPGPGTAFLPVAAALIFLSRRRTPGEGRFAISHWFNSFAAGLAISGLLISTVSIAAAALSPRAFAIQPFSATASSGEGPFTTATIIAAVPAVILSVTMHECAHGLVALAMGDDTAYKSGRVTLNPIRHIDPLGSVALPILLVAIKAPFIFGWARPVPVRFDRLRDPAAGSAAVSAAGAGANFILAAVSLGLFVAVGSVLSVAAHGTVENYSAIAGEAAVNGSAMHPAAIIVQFLKVMVILNISLALLNLIPIPPLDGAKLLEGLWPSTFSPLYAHLRPVGCLLIPGILLAAVCLMSVILSPALFVIFNVLTPFFARF